MAVQSAAAGSSKGQPLGDTQLDDTRRLTLPAARAMAVAAAMLDASRPPTATVRSSCCLAAAAPGSRVRTL